MTKTYLYAFLPEHQANMSPDELKSLHTEGITSLDKFVEDVNKLIDYPPEKSSNGTEHLDTRLTFLQRIQLFYFQNIFFRFVSWLLLLLATTTGLVCFTSLKITNLDINIMIGTVIATSVTGAAALTAIGNKSQKALQELKRKGVKKLHGASEEKVDD